MTKTSRPNTDATSPRGADADSKHAATAHERRARHNAAAADRYQELQSAHRVSDPKAAMQLGRTRQKVQQMRDPEDGVAYSVVDMRMDVTAIAVDMARFGLATHGYEPRKVHAHDTIEDDLEHATEMSFEEASLAHELFRACGNGEIDAGEATKLIALSRASIERHEALIKRLEEPLLKRASSVRHKRK